MPKTATSKRASMLGTTPVIVALVIAAVLFAVLLSWSTQRTDSLSSERETGLVSHVLAHSIASLEREQEASTISDRNIQALDRPVMDLVRIDYNFGPWILNYYGHDESYVIGRDDRPVYAALDGRRASPGDFERIRTVAMPLIAELRTRLRLPWRRSPTQSQGAPGITDVTVVNGHPAIVGIKPLVSHTGRLNGVAGREYLHIAVRRLDGNFLARLRDDYRFDDARFSWSDQVDATESALPFVSPRSGRAVGYLVWKPFRPGSIVLKNIVPTAILMMLLMALVTWSMLMRVRRGTAELQASEAQAKHLAFHDVLTGLPNRALFEDRLDRAIATSRRHPDAGAALLFLDVDRFKQVNDTLGHPAGDELIREIAHRLSCVVRDVDTVARLGGDEFAIIQADARTPTDIDALCQRILEEIGKPFDLIGSQVYVGISIGVARAGVDGDDRNELSRKADIALYHAKAQGRGRYAAFVQALDNTIQARQAIEQDLRAALDAGDQLIIHYQPQYDALSGKIVGVEALVRWQHPVNGMMCASTFVQIAEETGLIGRLGEWVLGEACAAAAHWPIDALSVNVSAVQLRDPLFAKRLLRILKSRGFEPGRLEIEITETAFIESAEQSAHNLDVLRAAGVRIALDDFGTGYSSFNHLRSLTVDRLKIDRSFIVGLDASLEAEAIVKAIVDLARSSGLKVTAEGVETVEQRHFLSTIGCDELQGFLMSRPITEEMMAEMLGVDNVLADKSSSPHAA